MFFRVRIFSILVVWLVVMSPCLTLGQQSATTSADAAKFDLLILEASRHIRNTSYDSASVSLQKALEMGKSSGNILWQARATSKIGELFIYKAIYTEAIDNAQSGLSLYEQVGDSLGIAESLNNIASIYYYQQEYEPALQNYLKSLAIRERSADKRALANNYNNVGSAYSKLGDQALARQYHEKSLPMWKELKSVTGHAITLNHIAESMSQNGDLKGALGLHLESYSLLNSSDGQKRTAIGTAVSIGRLYAEMDDHVNSVKWCELAYARALELDVIQEVEKSCYCLFEAYQHLGEPAKALVNYKRYVEMKDSVFGSEKIKEITRLELAYSYDKRQLADSLRHESESALQSERIQRQRVGLVSVGSLLLLAAILAMVILKGKRKSDDLLLNILPKQTAEELKKNGHAASKFYENVTILFTDFQGFTGISANMSPQDLVKEINECFSAFDLICSEFSIEKIKTIGDAYMAASGVPIPGASDAVNAVAAALKMQDFVVKRKQERESLGLPCFEMRVGIHTGPVVTGIVGLKKFQYDIWGDTVNTASRMESGGEVGRVNISQTTYEHVKEHFACSYRGEIDAKGKGKVNMYFVESEPV